MFRNVAYRIYCRIHYNDGRPCAYIRNTGCAESHFTEKEKYLTEIICICDRSIAYHYRRSLEGNERDNNL